MHTVKRSWLLILSWIFVATSFAYVVAYIAINRFGISPEIVSEWGVTTIVAGLCVAQVIYGTLIFPWFSKRNPWLASVLGILIYAMSFAAVIEASGRDNYIIRVAYPIFVFASSMVGVVAVVSGITITWALYIFILTGAIQSTTEEVITTGIINIAVSVAGILGWLIFRRHYIDVEAKKTHVALQLLEQEQFKSSVIIESIADGVLIIDTKGTVQSINQAAAQLLGWKQEEAVHLDYRSITNIHLENDEQDAITSCLSTKQATQKTQLFSTQGGKERYINTLASPLTQITDPEANERQMVGVIAIIRDVDEQKRQEQQRNEFISTASHEMRTPVASIQGFLELAMNPKVSVIDEKARTYLNKAHQATLHLGTLFQDLLTISQSDDGRLQYHPQIVDLQKFVEQLFIAAKMSAERAGLTAILDIGQGTVSPLIYANIDPRRFQEVFMNLFENAIKYTKVGSITVGLTTRDNFVTLRISDTGMGIAQEDIPHIFQKFYRTDNSETRAVGGTGLGLYIVQQIVTAMKGRITVESTVGVGSSFYITIPRVAPEQLPKNAPK